MVPTDKLRSFKFMFFSAVLVTGLILLSFLKLFLLGPVGATPEVGLLNLNLLRSTSSNISAFNNGL